MTEIEFTDILHFLESNQIDFTLVNEKSVKKEYVVASIFCPINQGFYYLVGNDLPVQIEDSLILCNKPLNTKNTLLVVKNIDIQLLYYRLLKFYFQQKSTGIIHSMTEIHPQAKLGKNVQIDAFTVLGNCKIGDNVVIGSHCKIYDNVIIGDNTVIESGSVIGVSGIAWTWDETQTEKVVQPQLGGVKIGSHCILSAQTVVVRGSLNENTSLGNYCFLAPGCRLGHGTRIGNYVHLANTITTAGNVVIGDYSFVGSGAVFSPKVTLHPMTIVGAGSVVIKSTTGPHKTVVGSPAREKETNKNPEGMPPPKIK